MPRARARATRAFMPSMIWAADTWSSGVVSMSAALTSLLPCSRMIQRTPGVLSASRSKRERPLGPMNGGLPSLRSRLPAMPALTTAIEAVEGCACRRVGERVRPPRVPIRRRADAVGDRVAQHHDGSGAAAGLDLHTGQEMTAGIRVACREHRDRRGVAAQEVGGLVPDAMDRRLRRRPRAREGSRPGAPGPAARDSPGR